MFHEYALDVAKWVNKVAVCNKSIPSSFGCDSIRQRCKIGGTKFRA